MSEDVELENENQKVIAKTDSDVNVFKKPDVIMLRKPSRKTVKILSEDSYLEEMGRIIERDFFPDLEKLKAQNDYLDALDRNDMEKVRELYAKYSSGKVPLQASERYASPATFETPVDNRPKQDDVELLNAEQQKTSDSISDLKEDDEKNIEATKKKELSLDQYLGSHTSEDNNSFQQIIKEAELQHRHKYSWLYKTEEDSKAIKEQLLALPSIEEQAQGKERPFNLDTWEYRNKNFIMYVPDGIELSEAEKSEQLSKRQQVNYSNTRLAKCPFDENQNKETIQGLALSQSRIMEGKIGVDGKEVTSIETPKVNGFSYVKTPSPAPGVNESPLMTWGNIEGTPFRLDGSDTPLRGTPGPSFKIPEPPKREKLALALAEKAGERHRDRKRKALLAARSQLVSPSPKHSSSHTLDILHSMSPAAQRLASTQLRRISSDRALIASYSPARNSPVLYTPSPSHTPSAASPKPNTPKTPLNRILTPKRIPNHNLTDNLLKLNLPKRPRAADFF